MEGREGPGIGRVREREGGTEGGIKEGGGLERRQAGWFN